MPQRLRLSSRVGTDPDDLIDHLNVISMQNYIDVFDDVVLWIKDFLVTALAIGEMNEDPCGF